MTTHLTRRDFLAASAAVGASLAMAGPLHAAPLKTTLHKALIGTPDEALLKQWKAAGFEGVEWTKWDMTPQEATAIRKMVEAQGLRIHSVMRGWANMNGGDAALAKSVAEMETALRTAAAFGADTVLLVPCRTGVTPIPEPWDFDLRFDEKTSHVAQVVPGDNAKYEKYIEAQNQAIDATRQGVKQLIPTAEKANVIIALENVWNNLW